MADAWATGVIHVFAGPTIDLAQQIVYLGEGKQAAQTNHENLRIPVQNDLNAGKYDSMHGGKRAVTSWTVTRTNLLNLELLHAVPSGVQGLDNLESIGTLLGTEGMFFPVWFLRARRNVAAMVAIGMRGGRRYPHSELIGWSEVEGVRENAFVLTFEHTQFYDKATGQFPLFDYDMTAVEAFDITQ